MARSNQTTPSPTKTLGVASAAATYGFGSPTKSADSRPSNRRLPFPNPPEAPAYSTRAQKREQQAEKAAVESGQPDHQHQDMGSSSFPVDAPAATTGPSCVTEPPATPGIFRIDPEALARLGFFRFDAGVVPSSRRPHADTKVLNWRAGLPDAFPAKKTGH